MSEYKEVIIETYIANAEFSSQKIRARPIEGQGFSTDMKVECSSKMRKNYPVGTKFKIKAKVTDREGGTPFLYSHHNWKYEVLTD